MNEYWILVADASRARLFAREKRFGPLEELESLIHPESRLRRQDLVSDRPGQVQESAMPGEYAAEQGTDPKKVEAQDFAHTLADHLNQAREADRFRHLVLLAEPHFLGILRKRLDKATTDAVAGAQATNVARESIDRITRAVDSALE